MAKILENDDKVAYNIFVLDEIIYWEENRKKQKEEEDYKKHFIFSSIKKRNMLETLKIEKNIKKIEVHFTPKNLQHSMFYFISIDETGQEYIAYNIKLEFLYKQNNFLYYFAENIDGEESEKQKYISLNVRKAIKEFRVIRNEKKDPSLSSFNYLFEYKMGELFKSGIMGMSFKVMNNIKITAK